MQRRLKAKIEGRASAHGDGNDEWNALRAQVDELKRENEELRRENTELKDKLQLKGKKREDEIDVDAFALCGAKRSHDDNNNGKGGEDDESDKMRECRCLAALAHAQAAQRAVTFFALQDTLLSRALDGARPHLRALNDSLPPKLGADARAPFLAPLKAQIVDLEKGAKRGKEAEAAMKARFIELRQHTTKPVTIAMRATMTEFVDAYDELDVGAISTAVERLRTEHNLLGADDMAALQRDGASDEDARSLEFLQRLYAVAKVVKEPLGQLLQEIGKGAGGKVEVQMGKLKGLERVFEKTMEEYDGDFSRLGDIVRGSLVCDGAEEVVGVLERVSAAVVDNNNGGGGAISSLRIVRVKNRLDRGFDAEAESGGYRDVLVNVALGVDREAVFGPNAPGGGEGKLVFLVCEIQAHVRSFHEIKGAGGAHKLYKQARSLHLLDKELGQEYVHGSKPVFDEAMEKVERGECRALRADFFQLDGGMATRLRDALLDRAVCSVQVLSLHGASLGGVVTQVFDGHHIEGLREVVLSGNKGIDGDFVARFISKHIRVLKFQECGVGAEGMRAIASRMKEVRPTELQELEAAVNNMGSEGAIAFAPALKLLTNLTTLYLYGNDLGSEGAIAMAPSLKMLTNLNTLYLFANNIGSEGTVAIAPSLKMLTKLTSLFLGGNGMGSEGAIAIAPSLEALTNLTSLDLGDSNMGREGAVAIAPSLKVLTNLTALYLQGNNMGSEGAAAIAPSLESLTNLTTLALGGNHMGSEGAVEVAPSLKVLTNLTLLALSANDIGSEGAAAIAPSLEALTNLTTLRLEKNDMGSEGAAAIAPALKALPNLTTLRLDRNGLTDADKLLVQENTPPKCSVEL